MNKYALITTFLITFLLTGCLQITPTSESPTLTTTITLYAATPTRLPTVTSSPTMTNTSPAEIVPSPMTPTATKSPTLPPEARMKKECLEVLPEIPSGAAVEGMIILESKVTIDDRGSFDTFLLNIENGTMTQLAKPNENLIYFAVSPDRQWVAYSRSLFDKPGGKIIEDQLVIATASGEQQEAFSWEKGWGHIAGWLDNQNLAINIAGLDPDESTGLKAASLLVLNPFTGERRILQPNFPDIYDMPYVPNWDGWGETMYDPALTRVVYPRWIDSSIYGYTLWDLRREQVLITLDFTFFPIPRWSPDGARFVLAGYLVHTGYELYSVDLDGKTITPLTNLSPYYSDIGIENYSWSPDSQYIAFWLNGINDNGNLNDEQQLAVLDTTTLAITNYCIPGDYEIAMGFSAPLPIWSPGGNQLVVTNQYAADKRAVILVDLNEGWAAQIAEDMEAVGWMKKP